MCPSALLASARAAQRSQLGGLARDPRRAPASRGQAVRTRAQRRPGTRDAEHAVLRLASRCNTTAPSSDSQNESRASRRACGQARRPFRHFQGEK